MSEELKDPIGVRFFYSITDPEQPDNVIVLHFDYQSEDHNVLLRLCWKYRDDPKFGFVPLLENQFHKAFGRQCAPLGVWIKAASALGEGFGWDENAVPRNSSPQPERQSYQGTLKVLEHFVNLPPEAFGVDPAEEKSE